MSESMCRARGGDGDGNELGGEARPAEDGNRCVLWRKRCTGFRLQTDEDRRTQTLQVAAGEGAWPLSSCVTRGNLTSPGLSPLMGKLRKRHT